MEAQRRRFGDRRDGVRVKHIDPINGFAPYLMPNRCDCEAYVVEQIDITNILAYLKEKNSGGQFGV